VAVKSICAERGVVILRSFFNNKRKNLSIALRNTSTPRGVLIICVRKKKTDACPCYEVR